MPTAAELLLSRSTAGEGATAGEHLRSLIAGPEATAGSILAQASTLPDGSSAGEHLQNLGVDQMGDSWGGSWGGSWGNSWGTLFAPKRETILEAPIFPQLPQKVPLSLWCLTRIKGDIEARFNRAVSVSTLDNSVELHNEAVIIATLMPSGNPVPKITNIRARTEPPGSPIAFSVGGPAPRDPDEDVLRALYTQIIQESRKGGKKRQK